MNNKALLSTAKKHFIFLYFTITTLLLAGFILNGKVSSYIFIGTCILLIAKWLWDWKNVFTVKKLTTENRVFRQIHKQPKNQSPTAYYDWQFKRLVTYILVICLIYIVYSFFQYYRERNYFYLGEITFSEELQKEGYNKQSLELQLREIKEFVQHTYDIELTRSRLIPMNPDFKKEQAPGNDFKVEGFTFPLTQIGISIGEAIFGERKKVNIKVGSDSVRYIAWVDFYGEAIKKFEEFFQDGFEKRLVLTNLLKKIEFYILEKTDPYTMSGHYIYYDDPVKVLDILPYEGDARYNPVSNYINKARVYSDLGDLNTAKRILVEGIHKHPRISGFYVDLSVLLSKQNRYDSAFILLKQALKINPRDGLVYQNLANYYYYDKPILDSAIYYYNECLSYINTLTNVDILDALFTLSSCYGEKKNSRLQDYFFLEACNRDPAAFDRLFYNEESAKWSANDIFQNPKIVPVSSLVSYCFRSSRSIDSLKQDSTFLEIALQRSPDLVPAKILLADYCYAGSNYYKGDSLINSVLLQQPNSYLAYYHSAQGYYNKDLMYAELQLRKSLQLNPDNIYAINLLSDILMQRGDKNEFVSNLQKLLWLSPGFYYYRVKMGDFYFFEKNWAKSAYYYRLGLENNNDNYILPQIYLRYAESSFNLGDYFTAGRYYDSCLQYRWFAQDFTKIRTNLQRCYQQLQ